MHTLMSDDSRKDIQVNPLILNNYRREEIYAMVHSIVDL